jgi:hypothetical protein
MLSSRRVTVDVPVQEGRQGVGVGHGEIARGVRRPVGDVDEIPQRNQVITCLTS